METLGAIIGIVSLYVGLGYLGYHDLKRIKAYRAKDEKQTELYEKLIHKLDEM